MLTFIIPYFFLHTDDNDIYVAILLIVYVFVLNLHYPFLKLLYKQGASERTFIYLFVATISISIILSLFPRNFFEGYSLIFYSLFIWYIYFVAFKAGPIYIKNKKLAESTGKYRPTENDKNP